MSADQLAVLCQRMADDSDAVRTAPEARALVESITSRLRDGAGLDDLTDRLDRLEEMLLRAGHAAGLSPVRSYERLLGTNDGHRVLEVLRCPAGTCTRVEVPGSEPTPCLVHRRPMVVAQLRS
ncbi:hypothetical protein AB0H71_06545 [Nocardia sp. NPDC050697]|uniref:hypothetical protein n=1 Tax=Nocardia sp. NPDC050697 TaxID=3155158 RepID=UPI0033D8728D